MLLLDDKKGGGKKPVKQGFCHSLLERRERVKRRERPDIKKHHHFTLFSWGGGLKNGQLWGPKISWEAFPGKAGGNTFFLEKAMLEKSQKTSQNDTCLGSLSLMQF